MKPRKYLRPIDIDNYTLDKIEINLYVKPTLSPPVKPTSFQNISLGRTPSHGIAFRDVYTGLWGLNRKLYFNLNHTMRNALPAEVWRCVSRSTFTEKDNFVPAGGRCWMKKKGIKISQARASAIDKIFEEIEFSKLEMASDFQKTFGRTLDTSLIKTSLNACELNYDTVQATGFQLALDSDVYAAVNALADSYHRGFFDKNGQYRICEGTNVKQVGSIKEPFAIYFYRNKTKKSKGLEVIIYVKEDGPYGALNRWETRFLGEHIAEICGGKSFDGQHEFVSMLEKLVTWEFENVIYVLGRAPQMTDKVAEAMLKEALKFFFKSDWDVLLKELLQAKRISTLSTSPMTKTVRNKTPKLEKLDIIFRKCGKATYEVNWEALPRWNDSWAAHELSKLEPKQKKNAPKIIDASKKDWLTIESRIEHRKRGFSLHSATKSPRRTPAKRP